MGMLSALPYVVYFVIINLGGFVADYLQNSGVASTLSTRRLAMIVGQFGVVEEMVSVSLCSIRLQLTSSNSDNEEIGWFWWKFCQIQDKAFWFRI